MSGRSEALDTLNRWFSQRDQSVSSSDEADWMITEYRDSFVFSPVEGRRSNLLYVVRGSLVRAFSPATTTLEKVHAELRDDSDATTTA